MGVTIDKRIYDYFDNFDALYNMNSLNFNIDNGYLEGLVRGFKAGILKHSDYANLVQCETLEGKYIMIISIPQSCKLGLSLGEVAIGQAISPIATHFCVA